jgi:HAMP domain-containing protein
MKLLDHLRINTKILGTVLVVLVLGGVLAALGIFYLSQANNRLDNLVDISMAKVRLAAQLNQKAQEIARAEKNYLLVASAVERSQYASRIDTLTTEIETQLRSLNVLVDADGRTQLDDFRQHWQAYLALDRQIRQLADNGQIQEATDLSRREARAASDLALAEIQAIVDKNDADLDRDKQLSDANYRQALIWMLSFSALALILGVTLGVNISRNIAANLGQMVHIADEISRGNIDHTLTIESRDETGDLAAAFRRMMDYIREVAGIAGRIAGGDLEAQVTPRSGQDTLNLAMRQMVASLNQITQENNRRIWQATGQAELTDQTRGQLETTELGRRIITFLCRYLEAQIGTLYLNNDGSLSLMSSCAYTHRKHLSDRFSIGQGIVGQAALEKQLILISNVPDDYIRVQSGLGDSPPRHLLAIPFLFNNQVGGVIELGRFQPWDEAHLAFLESVMEYIGIVFNVALAYSQSQELLAQTQQQADELQVQTEELQTQQEELRQANEALEQQTRLLRESEQELKAQQEELEVTNEELSEKTRLLSMLRVWLYR